ncbi:MAG: response regulator [Methanomicrobiales archaeon]
MSQNRKTISVLVVDDDPVLVHLIELRLQKMGYSVLGTALNGEEAIQKAANLNPQVAIMDIRLPGRMDGIDTANLLMEKFSIPVVYLTGDTDPDTFKRAILTEDCEYLTKPFTDNDLQRAIDLTFYKHQVNHKIRKNHEFFLQIFSGMYEALVVTDTEGIIVSMNPAAEAMIGTLHDRSRKYHNRELIVIVNPTDGRVMENPIDNVMRLRQSVSFPKDAVLVKKDQARMPVDGNISPIFDKNANIIGLCFTIFPVTRNSYLRYLGSMKY